MNSKAGSYVALLRGVNNAGARRVAMADLRALFEGLGFGDVCTLLNTGNVVFSTPKKGRGEMLARIEKELAAKLGLTSPVIVLSGEEIATIVRDNPLSHVATNPSHLLVVVPRTQSDHGGLRPLLKEQWTPEAFALGSRAAYLWCANGVAKSPLWAAVERALARTGTARNITTMTKLVEMVERRNS